MAIRILYTDYQYATYYVCTKFKEDGSCDQDSHAYHDVGIMARTLVVPSGGVFERLRQAVERTCYEFPDLSPSSYNGMTYKLF